MSDHLAAAFPTLGERLPKISLANLPTPLEQHAINTPAGTRTIFVKRDDLSSATYGGNKIRKLEYILWRAIDRGASRVATFGAVGSNHALATAILAHEVSLECTCFLTHQTRTPKIPYALNMHHLLGTEIVRYGGGVDSLPLFRRYLQNRKAWVIPLGGSSWLGAVGFVNAGLELAAQIAEMSTPCPSRIYIANGTMGSTAGLLLGLAAAELPIEVHAVRVADNRFADPVVLDRLVRKTALLLNRYDPSFDVRLAERVQLQWRDDFFAGGYAKFDEATDQAVHLANDDAGLTLETTYTGKAMAALLHDLQLPDYQGQDYLFWNTHSSSVLPVTAEQPETPGNIPNEFYERYYCCDV